MTNKIEARDGGIFPDEESPISATIKMFVDVIYCYCRDKLNSPELFALRISYYAQLIEQKTNGLVNFVWGFIDGNCPRHAAQNTSKRSAIMGTNGLMG
jgi:hypothetical protein